MKWCALLLLLAGCSQQPPVIGSDVTDELAVVEARQADLDAAVKKLSEASKDSQLDDRVGDVETAAQDLRYAIDSLKEGLKR